MWRLSTMNGDPKPGASTSTMSTSSSRRPVRGPPAHLKANPNFFASLPDDTPPLAAHGPRGRHRPASPDRGGDGGAPVAAALSAKSLALALRAARADGKLNLSNRRLVGAIPPAVWSMYDAPASATASLDTSAGDRWWDAVELTKLLLADNQLTELDPRLAQVFPALQVLDVHNNHLTSPGLCDAETLAVLTHLTALNLAGNRLTSVPACLAALPHLTTLALNNNSIAGSLVIPSGVLPKLAALDASDNLLSAISSDLSHLQALVTLKLANNRLRASPSVLPASLRELDLAGNQIAEVSVQGDAWSSLERLDLRRNRLTLVHIPTLAADLKELYLSSNRIATLSIPPGSLPKLALLDVRDNQLTEVPEEVYTPGAMPDLKRLDLTNNAISVLPPELGHVPLHALNVEGNLVRGLPRSGGTVALLKWLKEKLPPGYKPPSPARIQRTRNPPPVADPVPEPIPVRASAASAPVPARASARSTQQQQQSPNVEQAQVQPVEEWVTLPSGRRIRRKPSSAASTPMGLFGNAPAPAEPLTTSHDNNKRGSTLSTPAATPAPHFVEGGSSGLALKADMSAYPGLTATTLESLTSTFSPNQRSPFRSLTMHRVSTLGRFPDISPLTTLTDLTLTHCDLRALPAHLPVPPALASLDLSHNPLGRLPATGLTNAPALHTLTLVGCQLTGHLDLSVAFAHLPSIATLLLGNNQLTDVTVGGEGGGAERTLPRLVCLDVSNNALGRLDPNMARVPLLQVLKVEGNCFRVPRWDVVQRGSQAVLEWCRGRLPRE